MLKPIRTGVQFMVNLFWNLLAKLLARPAITRWLIKRAMRTPYEHITSADGNEIYMSRWWLLNPYNRQTRQPRFAWLPFSVRIHHIRKPDLDPHLHDHPWDARTLILKGWYTEQRLVSANDPVMKHVRLPEWAKKFKSVQTTELIDRKSGTSARLNQGEYHRIDEVSRGGVFTLFITYRGTNNWGFLVDGKTVPFGEYLKQRDALEGEVES